MEKPTSKEKLEKALERLEDAIETKISILESENSKLRAEVIKLKCELKKLSEPLANAAPIVTDATSKMPSPLKAQAQNTNEQLSDVQLSLAKLKRLVS